MAGHGQLQSDSKGGSVHRHNHQLARALYLIEQRIQIAHVRRNFPFGDLFDLADVCPCDK